MPQARSMAFVIDPAFLAGSDAVGNLQLCHVRLQPDARFCWLVLIPQLDGLREIEDLSPLDRGRLTEEIVRVGGAVRAVGEALGRPVEKLNVGQLGNLTAQLHIHVVGRRSDDPAWPAPVWGFGKAEVLTALAHETALAAARRALGL